VKCLKSVPFIGLNQTQWANKRLMATILASYMSFNLCKASPSQAKERGTLR